MPGLEAAQPQPDRSLPNLGARNAFARVPFPEYWGVTGDKYITVTPEHEALVEPLYLAERLENPESKHAINGVVFNPEEYVSVPTSVRTFASRVGARVLKGRVRLETEVEQKISPDKRAIGKAFTKSLPALTNLEKMYTGEIENLRWLADQIPYHWQSHGNEMNMRMRVVAARRSFDNIIETVAASDEWSKQQLRDAKLAQEKRLLYGTLVNKKAEWALLTKVAGNYAIGKRGIVRNKRDEMLRRIPVSGTVE